MNIHNCQKIHGEARSTPAISEFFMYITKASAGPAKWTTESGYRQQARVENTFGRYKRAFGGKLRSRDAPGQRVEVLAASRVLNRMLELGAARSSAASAE